MTAAATPLFFGPPARPLFGWVHPPAGGEARLAAVLCPPLGREHVNAYRTYRRLAERLAETGTAVVRFDYDGTGNSAGDHEEPGRVEAWLQSVAAAMELARRAGAPRVALVGMRAGAMLAALAAERDGNVDGLVLWDPCSSGRAFLRQQAAVLAAHSSEQASLVGWVHTPGYAFPPDVALDLTRLALPAVDGRTAGQVLVLTRDDRPLDRRVREAIVAPTVEWGSAVDQADLLDVTSPLQRTPEVSVEHITEWLSRLGAAHATPFRVPPSGPAVISQTEDRGPIVEATARLGPLGLFGITTAAARTEGPTVVFMTTATEHSIGPNRFWVELARAWAAAGLRCVRFDMSGSGDSPSRSGEPEMVVWSPGAFDDIADVTRAVCPDDPSDVVLVGLCSGGYHAFEAALALAPRGVCVINPVLSFDPPEMAAGGADPRRRVFVPRSRLVETFRDKRLLASIKRRFPDVGWRVRSLMTDRARPVTWLRELIDKDVDVLLICGEIEALPFRQVSSGSLRDAARSDRFRLECIPRLDHALIQRDHRTAARALLDDHVLSRFAGPAGASRHRGQQGRPGYRGSALLRSPDAEAKPIVPAEA